MEPVLIPHVREPNSFTLDLYLKHQGYDGLKKALTMTPEAIIDAVKASGLRGRGGAGLPDRHEVAVRGQEGEQAALHLLQRRRERAGHLQGPPADGAQPAPPHRGVRDRLLRHRIRRSPTSTSAASSCTSSTSSSAPSPRHTRPVISARTSTAAVSTATSSSTGAPARTRPVKRPRSSSRSRASARSRGSSRRFPPARASTTARRR